MSAPKNSSTEIDATSTNSGFEKRKLRFIIVTIVVLGFVASIVCGIAIWLRFSNPTRRGVEIPAHLLQQESDLHLEGPPSSKNFAPRQVVRPFPPITEFPVAKARDARGRMDDAELVLGVVVNDEARAYPINMLTGPSREILNDSLGGRAIAATW